MLVLPVVIVFHIDWLWLQLCFGSHSHVCGFGLYVSAVHSCGFTRLGDDCYHYYAVLVTV